MEHIKYVERKERKGMDDMVTTVECSNLSGRNLMKAFIDASRNGYLEMLCELLKNKELDLNSRDKFGDTALILASEEGHSNVVCELLKHDKIDVNARDIYGYTSLIVACAHGHVSVVSELMKHDMVDVNATSPKGNTCFLLENEKWFLEDEPRCPRKVYVNGRTALLWAVKYEHWDVVGKLLRNKEIDVNAQDARGYTALMWACLQSRWDALVMLLKHDNVDTNIKNKAGSTALDLALKCELHEIVLCLEEYTKVCLSRREAEGRGRRKRYRLG